MLPQVTQQIEYLPVESLIFDPENPRLPRTVNGNDETQVINWMLENENVTELMASIGEKGFFPAEPLLVGRTPNSDKYHVIEGNRRLTAVKLLLDPTKAKFRKNTIQEIVNEAKSLAQLQNLPVIKFDTSEDIQLYLGYRHITGVQPWDSLAKARYLKKLKQTIPSGSVDATLKSLAKIVGSRADHVKLLLTGLEVYEIIEDEGFFKIKELDEKTIKFGVLYTAINHSNVARFIGIDLDSDTPIATLKTPELKELTRWMFEKNPSGFTRLGESRNLRLLNKIVDNPKSLDAFRKEKSLMDAVLLTDEPIEIFNTSVRDALSKIQTARDYMHLIDQPSPQYEEMLLEIRQLSKTISTSLKARFLDNDDE